ncbi:DUF5000 domain-containing lipoprotein [Sphingobacterium faecale]|uniref:DUF4959 domain-containing protein n=1 Tax=Sphingobacterium faecale TaxID=2803775 RepID=A0ABS1R7Y7_9SPHI|nr:DUF5000 domain-containing lipoprotein [Sphingobacterium faecale]MBL1410788.1 DUF4959 domain-containing protein [Sphingobacterium faecale]
MKTLKFLCSLMTLFILISCEEEKQTPRFPGEAPEPITQYEIENTSGASTITFKLNDTRTAYVKAVYTVENGLVREAKSSKYANKLIVDGFAQAREYTIALYAVGKDEKESEPVYVIVNPETPPYQAVAHGVDIKEDWGGGRIIGSNPTGAQLMIGVLKRDPTTRQWVDVDLFFTESRKLTFNFRGQAPVETEFGIYTRDKWQNYSDTVSFTFEPWEEIKLPISHQNPAHFSWIIAGDALQTSNTYSKATMFDGRRATYADGFYSANDNTPFPKFVTLDLLKNYQLSRFKYWMNGPTVYYATANMKHIRIWGNTKASTDMSTWTLLGEWDNWRPSGRAVGEPYTDEDMEKALAGNDFDFPLDLPAVRYIRIEAVTSWEPRTRLQIPELEFYGRPIN